MKTITGSCGIEVRLPEDDPEDQQRQAEAAEEREHDAGEQVERRDERAQQHDQHHEHDGEDERRDGAEVAPARVVVVEPGRRPVTRDPVQPVGKRCELVPDRTDPVERRGPVRVVGEDRGERGGAVVARAAAEVANGGDARRGRDAPLYERDVGARDRAVGALDEQRHRRQDPGREAREQHVDAARAVGGLPELVGRVDARVVGEQPERAGEEGRDARHEHARRPASHGAADPAPDAALRVEVARPRRPVLDPAGRGPEAAAPEQRRGAPAGASGSRTARPRRRSRSPARASGSARARRRASRAARGRPLRRWRGSAAPVPPTAVSSASCLSARARSSAR